MDINLTEVNIYFQKVDQREHKNKTKNQERSEKVRANIYARNNPIFISDLPHDVWIQILLFLEPKDIAFFGQASSETYSLSNDYTLWKALYLKSFGSIQELTFTEDWKSIYVLEHKLSQKNTELTEKFSKLQSDFQEKQTDIDKLTSAVNELKDVVSTLTLKSSTFQKRS